ncbi:hypothetical protein BDQ17DRAFT_1333055 [Cyathus striatus]|nr:hypothetical protein BDQ17DRAFT_1333055 [Cyathus striatus]
MSIVLISTYYYSHIKDIERELTDLEREESDPRHVKMKDMLQAPGKKIYAHQVDSSVDVFVATYISSRLVPSHRVHTSPLSFGLHKFRNSLHTLIATSPSQIWSSARCPWLDYAYVFTAYHGIVYLCDMRSVTVCTKPAIGSRSGLFLWLGEGWREDYSWVRGLCALRVYLLALNCRAATDRSSALESG